jgi:hypothetical protein
MKCAVWEAVNVRACLKGEESPPYPKASRYLSDTGSRAGHPLGRVRLVRAISSLREGLRGAEDHQRNNDSDRDDSPHAPLPLTGGEFIDRCESDAAFMMAQSAPTNSGLPFGVIAMMSLPQSLRRLIR